MKATFISKEDDKTKFEMDFDAEEFDLAQIEVYKRTKDKFTVQGFRPGKAPRKMIEQHFGENVFIEEALDNLMQDNYPKAIAGLEIEPIESPEVEFSELKKGEGFHVTIGVRVIPQIEIKDYEGVKIKDVSYDITDEDVTRELTAAQERNSRLVDVSRAAEDGDTLNIDYAGLIGDDAFDGGTADGQLLKLGSGSFIPGFEEQLIGAAAGSGVDVKVSFPDDYHAEELKGKEAVFHVTVNAVKYDEKPEINDEFAQEISEFENLADLKADIRKKLEESAASKAEAEKKNAVLEAVYATNDIDAPTVMIEDAMDEMMNEFAQQLKQQGLDIQQYFSYIGNDPTDFRETLREEASRRVKMRLIVKGVAAAEGFTASDEDVEKELTEMAAMYGMEKAQLEDYLGDTQMFFMKDDIRNRKAVDYMFETAILEAADAAEA